MQRRDSALALDQAKMVLTVDDSRSSGDDFKLSPSLRGLIEDRRTTLEQAESNLRLVSGGRVNAAAQLRESKKSLADLLRDGYNHIRAIPTFEIDTDARRGAFIAYGWDNGKMGNLADDSYLLTLARQALRVTPEVEPLQAQYPKALLTRLETELKNYTDASAMAKIGTRQKATQARNAAMEALEKALTRVRYYYCQASDEADRSAELARVGFQPRRASGQRLVPKERDAPPLPEIKTPG